jgi:hypothetical protein
MTTTIWDLSFPSSGLTQGPSVEMRGKRTIAILLASEDASQDDGREKAIAIVFCETEAFKITYRSAQPEWMLCAYDRLVDLGETKWLNDIRDELRRRGIRDETVRHLMINFDDGPSFEFVCRGYTIEE